ncbi:helix-turn-helix domain-containing protein [Caballeronia sp.]|uniref:helix-turn-helix domain-containing protein n=1 Tax=Caballeronia sp. TaxID=1931223 RepID=UPI003C41FB5B
MNKTALYKLTSVATVAVHRSFRGAAKELGMSPSALSHAVAALEQRKACSCFTKRQCNGCMWKTSEYDRRAPVRVNSRI